MSKISTRSCRPYVKACEEFDCHGALYARNVTALDGCRMYVVFSYGDHWPLFVNHDGVWYENSSSRSRTTSCHRSKAHPHTETIPATCEELIGFVNYGMDEHPKIERLVSVSP